MPAPFAALEARVNAVTLAKLANVRLVSGVSRFAAVLDNMVYDLGEFGASAERRQIVTFKKADLAVAPKPGDTVALDDAHYSAAELLAAERRCWTLDRLAKDDGSDLSYWLR